MDSLIHYDETDIIGVLKGVEPAHQRDCLSPLPPAPRLLRTMHFVGKAFPRGDRSPAIKPVSETRLTHRISASLPEWRIGFTPARFQRLL